MKNSIIGSPAGAGDRRVVGSLAGLDERPAAHQRSTPHRQQRYRRRGEQREGTEAGVWVIAETTDLPTKFAKIVVTDDHGRYVLPDLPQATYTVWVRGYGLVESARSHSDAGQDREPEGGDGPRTRHAAAEYYPAGYWYSLIRVPAKSEFPGTGPRGNGISTRDDAPGQQDD